MRADGKHAPFGKNDEKNANDRAAGEGSDGDAGKAKDDIENYMKDGA